MQLIAQHGIDNQGKIENKQGNIQLNSKADIQNSGSIVARGGNIQKKPKLKSSKVAKRSQRQYHLHRPPNSRRQNSLIAAVDVTDTAHKVKYGSWKLNLCRENYSTHCPRKTTVQGKISLRGKLTWRQLRLMPIRAKIMPIPLNTVQNHDIQANSAQFSNQIKLTPKWLSTEGSQLTAEVIEAQQANLNAVARFGSRLVSRIFA